MKQKDIAVIIVVGFFSLIVSILLSNMLFNTDKDKKLETAIVTPITTDFDDEKKPYFGDDATNTTQTIKINENSNEQPFSR